jgi:hypothetical protein
MFDIINRVGPHCALSCTPGDFDANLASSGDLSFAYGTARTVRLRNDHWDQVLPRQRPL